MPSTVPAVGVRGKPHGGAGRGRGRDRDRAQPVTSTVVQEAPELPEVGDAHVFKHDVESNLRAQRWRRHVQLAWPVRCLYQLIRNERH